MEDVDVFSKSTPKIELDYATIENTYQTQLNVGIETRATTAPIEIRSTVIKDDSSEVSCLSQIKI